MRVVVGALLLILCAWNTHHRAQAWRTDAALWTAARRTAPALARPAFNLGVVYLKQAQWTTATHLFLSAAELSAVPLAPRDLRQQAGMGLSLIDAMGEPVCDRPSISRWCVWGGLP